MDTLLNYPLSIIFLASVVTLVAASEVGHRLGSRILGEISASTLEASVLGLLALMLSFTFSMALTRFEVRRDAVFVEANAIGTAALRASLLPAPHAAESLKLFRDYVQIRAEVAKHAPTLAEIEAGIAESKGIQTALWRQAKAALAKDSGMAPTGIYIQALNEAFDAQDKRLTAYRTRVPSIALIGLYGISIVAIGFAAYASGHKKRNWRLPVYITAFLVASVMLLIQDLDRPGRGLVLISQQPMIDTADAVANHLIEFEKDAAAPGQKTAAPDESEKGANAPEETPDAARQVTAPPQETRANSAQPGPARRKAR